MALSRRPWAASGQPAPYVWPLNCYSFTVFWLGRHMYTGTCFHANDTQTVGSLTAARAIFNFHFHFWSSSHTNILLAVGAIDCMKIVCSKFTAKRKVDSENQQFKKNGLKNLHLFSLQPAQDPCA